MRVGMPTLLELNTIEDNVKMASDLGLDFVELNMNLPEYQPENIDIEYLKQLRAETGIGYTLHLPEDFDPAIFNKDIRNAHLQVMKKAIAIAKELSIPTINFHLSLGIHFAMPDEKILLYIKYIKAYVDHLVEFREMVDKELSDSDIVFCIENTGIYSFPFIMHAVELLLESPHFMLTWDVGHDHSAGNLDRPLIERHMPRLKHMHLHDAIGIRNHLPLGTGSVDIKEKLDVVNNHGLSLVLETKTANGLRTSMEYLEATHE